VGKGMPRDIIALALVSSSNFFKRYFQHFLGVGTKMMIMHKNKCPTPITCHKIDKD